MSSTMRSNCPASPAIRCSRGGCSRVFVCSARVPDDDETEETRRLVAVWVDGPGSSLELPTRAPREPVARCVARTVDDVRLCRAFFDFFAAIGARVCVCVGVCVGVSSRLGDCHIVTYPRAIDPRIFRASNRHHVETSDRRFYNVGLGCPILRPTSRSRIRSREDNRRRRFVSKRTSIRALVAHSRRCRAFASLSRLPGARAESRRRREGATSSQMRDDDGRHRRPAPSTRSRPRGRDTSSAIDRARSRTRRTATVTLIERARGSDQARDGEEKNGTHRRRAGGGLMRDSRLNWGARQLACANSTDATR